LSCPDVGIYRVVSNNPSIDCRVSGYHALTDRVGFVLALTLALPIAIAAVLFKYRHELKSRQSFHSLPALNIFVEIYSERWFFWQLIVLVRRTVYAGIAAVIDPASQALGFCLASAFFSLIHQSAQPYREKESNFAESVSITLHTALAAVVLFQPTAENTAGQTAAMVLLVTIPAVLLILTIIIVEGRKLLARGPTKSPTTLSGASYNFLGLRVLTAVFLQIKSCDPS